MNSKAWLWAGAAWLSLSMIAAAWAVVSLDSCMKWGYSGVECLQQAMGK